MKHYTIYQSLSKHYYNLQYTFTYKKRRKIAKNYLCIFYLSFVNHHILNLNTEVLGLFTYDDYFFQKFFCNTISEKTTFSIVNACK